MSELPNPPIAADADLRDFQFMGIDINRLFGSEFHARATDSEWRAGVTLWLKSFHQVPAASLPDDDIVLARLAEFGRDVKGWIKVKGGALHGWVRCSDGRWYHPVVAEKAGEAWSKKLTYRSRSKRANDVRWGKKETPDTGGDPAGSDVSPGMGEDRSSKKDQRNGPKTNARNVQQGIQEGHLEASLDHPKGQGQYKNSDSSVSIETYESAAASAAPDPVKVFFDTGISVLTELGIKPTQCRSLLGKLRQSANDDMDRAQAIVDEMAETRPADPASWLIARTANGRGQGPPGPWDERKVAIGRDGIPRCR